MLMGRAILLYLEALQSGGYDALGSKDSESYVFYFAKMESLGKSKSVKVNRPIPDPTNNNDDFS